MPVIRTLLLPIRHLMVLALVLGAALPTVVTTGVCRAARGREVRTCCHCHMMSSMMMAAMPGGAHRGCPATAIPHQKPLTCTVINTRQLCVTAPIGIAQHTAPLALIQQATVSNIILNSAPPPISRFHPVNDGFSLPPLRSKCVLLI